MDELQGESISHLFEADRSSLLESIDQVEADRSPFLFFLLFARAPTGQDPPSWDPASSVGYQVGCALEVRSFLDGPEALWEARHVVGDKSASLTPLPSSSFLGTLQAQMHPESRRSNHYPLLPEVQLNNYVLLWNVVSSCSSRLIQGSSTGKAPEGRSPPLMNIRGMITGS
jgi:hypothetical protein